MSDLRELYQTMILDHYKKPRNFGRPAQAGREAVGDNPLCGDRITVYLDVDDSGGVRGIGFEGSGCALSPAAGRLEELEEIAGTVAQTLLGLTVNCARCHDHKFDPITTREYYRSNIKFFGGAQTVTTE